MSKETQETEINWEDFSLDNILSDTFESVKEEEVKEEVEVKTEEKEETKEETKEEESKPETEEVEKEEKEKPETETEEVDETESVKSFYKLINDELGLEGDVDEEYLNAGISGIASYLKDIAASTIEQELDGIKEMGDGLMGDLYDYLKNGGKPEKFIKTFLQSPDYSDLTIEGEDNIINQKFVIKSLLEREGYDDEDIKDKIEGYEAAGITEKEAKIAKKKLGKLDEQSKQNLIKDQEQAMAEHKKRVENYWADVVHTIKTSSEIGGLPLNEAKKPDFIKYLTQKDKEGLTPYERKTKADKHAALKMAYASFLDFKYDDIKTKAKTEATKEVKKAITKFTDTGNKIATKAKEQTKEDGKDIDFSKWQLPFLKNNK